MPKSLKGQIVLVTGASSGFGADSARLFAGEGCAVILAARRMDRLTSLAEEIRLAGGEALPVKVDVTQLPQIDNLVRTALEAYGRIDILFNNAGFGRLDWLEVLDPVLDIDAMIDVNLRGVVQVARAVLPPMLERQSGHIINMSSVSGMIAAPLYSLYAATKYGVRAFNDALRREVRPFNIHVSGVYPAGAATEFSRHIGGSTVKAKLQAPAWLTMSSTYVASRIVHLAKHPRRSLVLPGWFRPVFWFDFAFPGFVDWLLNIVMVKRLHQIKRD